MFIFPSFSRQEENIVKVLEKKVPQQRGKITRRVYVKMIIISVAQGCDR
jgi:hypothetical protein